MSNKQVFEAISNEIARRAGEEGAFSQFAFQTLSTIVWVYAAFCCGRENSEDEIKLKENLKLKSVQLLSELNLDMPGNSLVIEGWQQLAQAAAYFQLENVSTFSKNIASNTTRESDLQKNVGKFLEGHGFRKEVQLGDHLARHQADFYRESDQMVIEVDGPTHFKDGQLTIETKLRNAILTRNGISLICIPFYEWDALRDDEAKKQKIRSLIG